MTGLKRRAAPRAEGRFFSRQVRRVKAHLSDPAALLIYHHDYEAPYVGLVDPQRGKKILSYLVSTGTCVKKCFRNAGTVSIGELAAAHDYDYLQSLDDPKVLHAIFGAQTDRVQPERLIRQQRTMVAGTLTAAKLAHRRGAVACPVFNLGGGLHHARADRGEGFCVFNDVAVAIRSLRDGGFDGRALVVDLDLHQGNGTRSIFADDDSVFTFSIHATVWDDSPVGDANLDVALGTAVSDSEYLEALREHLPIAFERARPELVFYVAGCDVAADDVLGSWHITEDGLLERDQLVHRAIGALPSVWLLAGGYGEEAWRYTAHTLSWMLGGPQELIPTRLDLSLARFRKIAAHFTPHDLSGHGVEGDDDLVLSFSDEDVYGDLFGSKAPKKVLGFYSIHGIETALERYGILRHIRKQGIPAVSLESTLDHPTGELLRLRSADPRKDILIELVIRESNEYTPYRLLFIEWLLLQNPCKNVSSERPLLPGQEHPGLGCLDSITMMLVMACERLELDGIVFLPAYFHVAAQAKGLLTFLDPEAEARFHLMQSALEGCSLAEATRVVHSDHIVDAHTGEPYRWHPSPMVFPVSRGLKEHINGSAYADAVRRLVSKTTLERLE